MRRAARLRSFLVLLQLLLQESETVTSGKWEPPTTEWEGTSQNSIIPTPNDLMNQDVQNVPMQLTENDELQNDKVPNHHLEDEYTAGYDFKAHLKEDSVYDILLQLQDETIDPHPQHSYLVAPIDDQSVKDILLQLKMEMMEIQEVVGNIGVSQETEAHDHSTKDEDKVTTKYEEVTESPPEKEIEDNEIIVNVHPLQVVGTEAYDHLTEDKDKIMTKYEEVTESLLEKETEKNEITGYVHPLQAAEITKYSNEDEVITKFEEATESLQEEPEKYDITKIAHPLDLKPGTSDYSNGDEHERVTDYEEVGEKILEKENKDENVKPTSQSKVNSACGGIIELNQDTVSHISSPNYPNDYGMNIFCQWNISLVSHLFYGQIVMNFEHFLVEKTEDCFADFLEVYDVVVQRRIKYCGSRIGKEIISAGNTYILTFKTDNTLAERGFRIRISAVPSTCGDIYKPSNEEVVVFSTPNYPNNYPSNTRCHWLVYSSDTPYHLTLQNSPTFSEISGLQVATSAFKRKDFEINKYYISNLFSIIFNGTKLQANETRGIALRLLPVTFSKNCSGVLNVTSEKPVLLQSEQYPLGFRDNARCSWTINFNLTSDFDRSRMTFIDLDIESGRKCRYDRFSVIDEAAGKEYTYCGTRYDIEYTTRTPQLKAVFESDDNNLYSPRGFSIFLSISTKREIECEIERPDDDTWVLRPPVTILPSSSSTSCIIEIQDDTAFRFDVTFSQFNLITSGACIEGDYLKVYDPFLEVEDILCGNRDGYYFPTSTNRVNFTFSLGTLSNFEIVVTARRKQPCGGNLVIGANRKEQLSTKFDNIECVWVVKGNGSILSLDFSKPGDVLVSTTGLYRDLRYFTSKVVPFIEPSIQFMVVPQNSSPVIEVKGYLVQSECDSLTRLNSSSLVFVTNSTSEFCSFRIQNVREEFETHPLSLTLLSYPVSVECPWQITDYGTTSVRKVCSSDIFTPILITSKQIEITGSLESSDVTTFMLIETKNYSCAEFYRVGENPVTVRSSKLRREGECFYRFGNPLGRKMVLQLAARKIKDLEYLRLAIDGNPESAASISSFPSTIFSTTKEFLVFISSFPPNTFFVFQVGLADLVDTQECDACLVLRAGDTGFLSSPSVITSSSSQTTSPSRQLCNINFQSHGIEEVNVVMTFDSTHLPTNASIASLSLINGNLSTRIDPCRIEINQTTFVSETPFVLQFSSDFFGDYHYKIKYVVQDCGGKIILSDTRPFVLRYPGHLPLYPTSTQCDWIVRSNLSTIGDTIRISFKKFSIDESDYLLVYDSLFSRNPVANLTGSLQDGYIFKSRGNEVRLKFVSDGSITSNGFVIKIAALGSKCSVDIDAEEMTSGELSTFPFFPNTESCLFRILAQKDSTISLTLLSPSISPSRSLTSSLQAERDSSGMSSLSSREDCSLGAVWVSTTGFLEDEVMYCIEDIPDSITNAGDILLRVAAPPLPPVRFNFSIISCGGLLDLSSVEGVITSPGYPNVFEGPLTCVWTLNTGRPNMLISLFYLDLEPGFDYLHISDKNQNLNLTGQTLQLSAYLLSAPAEISFIGTSQNIRKGFRIEFITTDPGGFATVPALIHHWEFLVISSQNRRVWSVTGPEGGRGLSVVIWFLYIPLTGTSEENYLQIASSADFDSSTTYQGLTMFRSLEFTSNQVIFTLKSSSPYSQFVISVHSSLMLT